MSTDWLGPRIYRPSLEEVLRGAISPAAPHVHYITHFRYPSDGGFMRYLNKFVPMGNLMLNHEVTSINPRAREAHVLKRPGREVRLARLLRSAP